MWNWTPVKKVFETLWTRGDLTVCERRGFERIYDLTERVIPARYLDEPPSVDECLRFFVRRTVRARGVVTLSRVWDHYRVRGQQRRVAGAVAEVLAAGEAIPARVGDRDALLALDWEADAAKEARTPVLLCPFDNLVWDREETERLFGFSYRIEIYTRPEDRRYGYYVLPLLAGDRLVGRVDVRSDRKAGLAAGPGRALGGAARLARAPAGDGPARVDPGAGVRPRGPGGPRGLADAPRRGGRPLLLEQEPERLQVVAHHAPLGEALLDVGAAGRRGRSRRPPPRRRPWPRGRRPRCRPRRRRRSPRAPRPSASRRRACRRPWTRSSPGRTAPPRRSGRACSGRAGAAAPCPRGRPRRGTRCRRRGRARSRAGSTRARAGRASCRRSSAASRPPGRPGWRARPPCRARGGPGTAGSRRAGR